MIGRVGVSPSPSLSSWVDRDMVARHGHRRTPLANDRQVRPWDPGGRRPSHATTGCLPMANADATHEEGAHL